MKAPAALLLAVLTTAASATATTSTAPNATPAPADPVRVLDRPYVRPQALQDALPTAQAQRPARPQPTQAQQAPSDFSLLVTDQDVGRAFTRWARERRVSVRWLLGRDLPIDAGAQQVIPDPRDVRVATEQGSVDPELAAAMVKVARAFANSQYPFVVREYDNAYVIEPKSGNRP